MKAQYFFSAIVVASAFTFLSPQSVTKKLNLAGKALYGADAHVGSKKTATVLSTQPPQKMIQECEVPERPQTITGPVSMCAGSTYTFTAAPVNGATSYIWELPLGWVGNSTTNVMTARTGDAGGDVRVMAVNDCGNSEVKHFTAMLSASPVLPVISTDGTDFISSAPEGNQWYFESNPIKDATDKTYTPTAEGKYHVCVTNRSSCTSCSEVMESSQLTVLLDAGEAQQDEGLIFPNPSTGLFTVKAVNCNDFIIYDSQGVLVYSQKMDQDEVTVDMTWRPKGPYWVEFHYGNNTVTRKILIN